MATTTAPTTEALMRRVVGELDSVLASLEPEAFDVDTALDLLALFTKARNAAAAGEAMVARRVDESGAHRQTGHHSTAHLLAEVGGTSLTQAHATVETGKRLRDLSATDEALRAGTISLEQAHAVTAAATADPAAETELLTMAGRESVRRLRERARDVRLAADHDRLGRHRRQHAARSLRHGRDDDGMVWGHFQLPPELGAPVVNCLERQADREFRTARTEGRREDHDRYLADALVTPDSSTSSGSPVRRGLAPCFEQASPVVSRRPAAELRAVQGPTAPPRGYQGSSTRHLGGSRVSHRAQFRRPP